MTKCPGAGRFHSIGFAVGEYRSQKNFARGRNLTFRGVEVRKCGCQTFRRLGQLADLVFADPRVSVFVWDAAKEEWSR